MINNNETDAMKDQPMPLKTFQTIL